MAKGKLNLDLSEGEEWKAALGISLLLHLLLLASFAVVRISFEFRVPEFVEVTFASGALEPSGAAPAEPSPVRPTEKIEENATTARQAGEGQQIIALPKRRMLEEEEPVLRTSDEGKLSPTEELAATIPPRIREPAAPPPGEVRGVGEAEKISPLPETTLPTEKPVAQPSRGEGKTAGEPFVITGEAAQRTVLYKVIPEYPEGLNKEAVVRIRFTVTPAGLVGSAVLLTKGGDATLERLTLEAFRQWRFNPLPPDVPQVEQEGTITFRWILR